MATFVYLFLVHFLVVFTFGEEVCQFSGSKYRIGQKWYRRLDTPDSAFCVACSCNKDRRVDCKTYDCAELHCDDERSNHSECCSQCLEDESPNFQKTATKSVSSQISCLHNGRVYHDGQSFTSNSTGLQRQHQLQCVQCVCQGGMVLCRLKTCTTLHCKNPIYSPDDCCPTCPVEQESKGNGDSVLMTVFVSDDSTVGKQDDSDCMSGSELHKHGSKWHPVIGPFGQMDCVVCKCQFGKIECNRLSCSAKPHCANPKIVQGHCCPICSDENLAGNKMILDEKKSSGLLLCLAPSTDTIVFRSHASSGSSGYYQYAFKSMSGSTRMLSWTIKDGRTGDFSEQHLTKENFIVLTQTFKFKSLGSTKSRLVQKFMKKAKKLPEKCGARCDRRIERLENILKMKEVAEKAVCSTDEMAFDQFHSGTVKESIHGVLLDELGDKTYNSELVQSWTTTIADAIRIKVKELGYERYKLVVQVVIGEQRGAGVKMGSCCLWDADTDGHASDMFMNDSLFCVASVFGTYYY